MFDLTVVYQMAYEVTIGNVFAKSNTSRRYKHATVNHGQNFIDHETGNCTNTFKGDGMHVKEIFSKESEQARS